MPILLPVGLSKAVLQRWRDSLSYVVIGENSSVVVWIISYGHNLMLLSFVSFLTFLLTEKPAHGKLSEYTTVNDTITYVPNPGHQGTDFFTYHMQLGSLHTNPVTVAITVTTPEEVERLGTSMSQQPSGTGFLSSRHNLAHSSAGAGGDRGTDYESVDEEMGSVVPPPPMSGAPQSSHGAAHGASQAPQYATATPPGGFNRKASYRDPPSAPGAANTNTNMNASVSSYTGGAAGGGGGGGGGANRSSTTSPTRGYEMGGMSTMNTSTGNLNSSGRRPPSVGGDEPGRRPLIPGGEASGEKKPRNASTNQDSVSRRK